MKPKDVCDECGKEIDSYGTHLYGAAYHLWGIIDYARLTADFCSKECLKTFIEKL